MKSMKDMKWRGGEGESGKRKAERWPAPFGPLLGPFPTPESPPGRVARQTNEGENRGGVRGTLRRGGFRRGPKELGSDGGRG